MTDKDLEDWKKLVASAAAWHEGNPYLKQIVLNVPILLSEIHRLRNGKNHECN